MPSTEERIEMTKQHTKEVAHEKANREMLYNRQRLDFYTLGFMSALMSRNNTDISKPEILARQSIQYAVHAIIEVDKAILRAEKAQDEKTQTNEE